MDAIQKYIEDTHACLKKASEMFGVNLSPANVIIECNVRGRCAGWAHPAKHGKYRLRFNEEAILKFPEEMADTIPHEVAHLVCFARRELGKNHDAGWKRVCRMLGGDDSRTHDMVLTPAKEKVRVRYEYNVCGEICIVGPRQHKMIQAGATKYSYHNKRLDKYIVVLAHMWTESAKVKTTSTANWTQTTAPVESKRDTAARIFKANPGLSRKDMIAKFVAEANMTPAGAATYYQSFKSKGV